MKKDKGNTNPDERPQSIKDPVPSCKAMRSDGSMMIPINLKGKASLSTPSTDPFGGSQTSPVVIERVQVLQEMSVDARCQSLPPPPPPPYPGPPLQHQVSQLESPIEIQMVQLHPSQCQPLQLSFSQSTPLAQGNPPVSPVEIKLVHVVENHLTPPQEQPLLPPPDRVVQPQPQAVAANVLVAKDKLGPRSTITTCPNCRQRVETQVRYKTGCFTWYMCFLLICFGMVCGCCLIPFYCKRFKDAHHSCRQCNVKLHVHKRCC